MNVPLLFCPEGVQYKGSNRKFTFYHLVCSVLLCTWASSYPPPFGGLFLMADSACAISFFLPFALTFLWGNNMKGCRKKDYQKEINILVECVKTIIILCIWWTIIYIILCQYFSDTFFPLYLAFGSHNFMDGCWTTSTWGDIPNLAVSTVWTQAP